MDPGGTYRISSQWGKAMVNNRVMFDVVELTATVEIARITVPLVGAPNEAYKMGRRTSEGTMRVQKTDSDWEQIVYKFLALKPEEIRAARGVSGRLGVEFDVLISLDDPEAWSEEKWQLQGCRIWRLPLGFSINDELTEREYPFTFEKAIPMKLFSSPIRNYTGQFLQVQTADPSKWTPIS